jgi:hypothetical protein
MKNNFNETNLLPLTFKYIEIFKNKVSSKDNKKEDVIYFIECQQYQSNFYIRQKPMKSLNRLL